jgi:hypothetical protein
MASEAQAQAGAKPQAESEDRSATHWALEKIGNIVNAIDTSKCPPEIRNVGTLGLIAGLYVALNAIKEGLSIAGTRGCNIDICQTVMNLIEKDLERIVPLLNTVEDFIKNGKLNNEVKELIIIEETLIIYEVAHFYPMLIDLLTRYGRGRV